MNDDTSITESILQEALSENKIRHIGNLCFNEYFEEKYPLKWNKICLICSTFYEILVLS